MPPIPGKDAAGCFVYRTLDDLDAIEAYAKTANVGAVVGGGLLEATGTVGDAPVGGGEAVVVNSGAPVSGGLVDPAPGDVAVAALDAATVVVADGEAEVVEAAVVVAVVAAVVVVGSFDVACRPKSAV